MGDTRAQRLVAGWERAGVELALGLDDPQALFTALRRSTIRTVMVHDERSGAFMADGYARAAGKPAVCAGISGPGAANMLTGLCEAYTAFTPVIAVVGEAIGSHSRPAFQQFDHARMLGEAAKEIVELDPDSDLFDAGARSAGLATSGLPRPVLVLGDAQKLWDEAQELTESESRQAPSRNRGTTSSVSAPTESRLLWRSAPAGAERALGLLNGAERPLILAGNGVHIADARAELQRFAEMMHVPVVTSLLGKGALAETHPLSLGVASAYNGGDHGHGELNNRLLANADVLVVIGSDLDQITTSSGDWPSRATQLIWVDVDMTLLSTREGLRICGDARDVLNSWLQLGGRPGEYASAWTEDVCAMTAESRGRIQEIDESVEGIGVWPGSLVREMARLLSEKDAIVTDASYSSAWALDRVRQAWAGRFVYAPRGTGVLGWGLPAALGVKLARPESSVACLSGDGGLLFSLAELETAVRADIPVVLVLLNNGSYGFQRHGNQVRKGNDWADLELGPIDWCGLARSLGWEAKRVEDLGDFSEAFIAASSASGPFLIDVLVDPQARPPLSLFSSTPPLAVIGH